jgi:isopentenyl phosphate kinase
MDTTEEKILNDTIEEMQGSCLSGEIEWDTCIKAMNRIKAKTISDVKEQLLKQLMPVIYENGYPIDAVPKTTILSLEQLMNIFYKNYKND